MTTTNTSAKVTVTKMEWVKDAQGNHVYTGLDKFRTKLAKQAIRFNKKLAESHAKGSRLSYSLLDVEGYVESMVKIYGHQFRAMAPGAVTTY